jgi:hypothetical protein
MEEDDDAPLLPTPALDFHLSPRRAGLSPVHLDLAKLEICVTGDGDRRDCQFTERYEGRNVSGARLGSIDLKLDADFYAPLKDARLELFDLAEDPRREAPIQPIRVEETPYQKWLSMPFAEPGIQPDEPFSVEMRYSYRNIVNAYLDYWFLDPLAHARSTERLAFTALWRGDDLRHALHLTVDRVSKTKRLSGRLPITRSPEGATVRFAGVPERSRVDVFVLGTATL